MEHLKLELRNAPEEIVRQGERNFHGFGALLTLERYLAREARLNKLPFGAGGNRWALVDQRTGEWTSTCETYHRPCLYTDGLDEDTLKVVVRKGTAAVVASVFTPEEMRGIGYAGEMMRQLNQRLRGFEDVALSTLYSDIGPTFYTKLGWKKVDSKEAVLTWDASNFVAHRLAMLDISEVRSVPEDELFASYLLYDISLLSDDLVQKYYATNPDDPARAFTILPTEESIRWMWERTHIYREQLVPKPEAGYDPINFTFSIGQPSFEPTWSYFVLHPNFREQKITILRSRLAKTADRQKHARALLLATIKEAIRLGLKGVVAWDTSLFGMDIAFKSLQDLGNLKIGERAVDDSLSSVCWFGGENERRMHWVGNEKFAWA